MSSLSTCIPEPSSLVAVVSISSVTLSIWIVPSHTPSLFIIGTSSSPLLPQSQKEPVIPTVSPSMPSFETIALTPTVVVAVTDVNIDAAKAIPRSFLNFIAVYSPFSFLKLR